MELLQNFYETTLDALRDAKVKSSVLQLEYTESRFIPFSENSISYLWLRVTGRNAELLNRELWILFLILVLGTVPPTGYIFQNGSNIFPIVNYRMYVCDNNYFRAKYIERI
jgi:hypothetical protein